MAISHIYKCDCCGHAQENPEQMWNIHIGYTHATHYGHSPSKANEQLWCRKCMEKCELLRGKNSPKEQEPPAPAPTLEEIVRQIMREEITAMTGAA